MTKEEFKENYIENSNMTEEQFDTYLKVIPCNCDYEGCHGWGASSLFFSDDNQ